MPLVEITHILTCDSLILCSIGRAFPLVGCLSGRVSWQAWSVGRTFLLRGNRGCARARAWWNSASGHGGRSPDAPGDSTILPYERVVNYRRYLVPESV